MSLILPERLRPCRTGSRPNRVRRSRLPARTFCFLSLGRVLTITTIVQQGKLHSFGRADAKQAQSVAQDDLGGTRQRQPRFRYFLGLLQHVMLVIPYVGQARGLEQISRNPVWLE